MPAYSNINQVIEALTTAGDFENLPFYIDNRESAAAATATVASRWSSLWTWNAHPNGTGAAPTTAVAYDRTANGCLKQVNPAASKSRYLVGGTFLSSQTGTLLLYDRLGAIGNLNGTTTTAQTFTITPTRYDTNADCVGNIMFIEIYTIIGTTATTITVEYTSEAPATATSKAVAIGGTGLREANRMIMVPLADGDTGVKDVRNVDLVATTGTAGAFGVTLARKILEIPVPANVAVRVNLLTEGAGPVEILEDACLDFAFFANTTTAPQIQGTLIIGETP